MHQLLGFFLVDAGELSKLFDFKSKMAFLTFQAANCARINIDLQFQFSVILLWLLDFVPEQVEFILSLIRPELHVSHLTALNLHLSIERPDCLPVLQHLTLVFSLLGF